MPQPRMAAPIARPDSAVPADPPTLNGLDPSVTGGVFHSPNILLPAGTTLKLQSDLILVADGLLQIDGIIELDVNIPNQVNITLVSRNGDVRIMAGAKIHSQAARAMDGNNHTVKAANAVAQAWPGVNGGFVKIVAEKGSIEIEGDVFALRGGDGGTATASIAAAAVGLFGFGGGGGGSAEAVGAQAGAGGELRLCAYEGIRVVTRISSGWSGSGGNANATSNLNQTALAVGGSGNDAGDVVICGLAPKTPVSFLGSVVAGSGMSGGIASARVIAPEVRQPGGKAEAYGGHGMGGGTVLFSSCEVQNHIVVDAGMGGAGGDANGIGGAGGRQFFGGGGQSHPGGPVEARGGNGGKPGAVPQIPVFGGMDNGTINGQPAAAGPFSKGGDANGVGGMGGAPFLGRRGGNSGVSFLRGGTGGITGVLAKQVNTPMVLAAPAAGSPGAVAAPGVSFGTK